MKQQMEYIPVNPGDVVVTNFGIYQHWSLVTDKICNQGKHMLISATKRNGTVKEEPWEVVTQGNHTYVAHMETTKPAYQIINDARMQIGKWVYSISENNCEHFIKYVSGLEVSSSQLKAGLGGALTGAALVGSLAENPKLIKFLAGALLVGGIAIATAKAMEKEPNQYI